MLFSDRSLLTMLHGIVLGGGALVLLVTALFALRALAPVAGATPSDRQTRYFVWLTVAIAALLWTSVLSGTYVVFPPYRATPPEGVASLAAYPRALIMSSADTRWLHAFGMEIKEHLPWIAAMLATGAAVVARRHRATVLTDDGLRRIVGALLGVCAAIVAWVALLGILVNKVAPLW